MATLILAGMAGAISNIHQVSPEGTVNQLTPLITWAIVLETDSGGNATYTQSMDGLLYAVAAVNSSLTQSTPVKIALMEPYERDILTIDPYAGNNTTYVRDGAEMFAIMGDVQVSVIGGSPNAEVPIYLTVQR
jgi:hypothetical protein